MAFFAESTYEESYQDLGIVVNDYTDLDMLAMEACTTIQEMDNAIMFGIGKYELAQVREGAEVVYTEGMMDTIKGKIQKIWNFIKNWIKSVWNKFIAWLESYVRGDKAFLSKYKKKLDENLVYLDKDFDKTYKYAKTIEKRDAIVTKEELIDEYENEARQMITAIKDIKKQSSTDIDKARARVDDALEKLDDLFESKRDKLKDVDDSVDVNPTWIRNNFENIKAIILMDTSKAKNAMNKAVKAAENVSKDIIKEISDVDKITTNTNKKSVNTIVINACKSASAKLSNQLTWINNQMIKTLRGAKSDARSICRVILSAKPNPKYNESTIFSNNDFESYFNI